MKIDLLRKMVKEELLKESAIISADNAIWSAMVKYRQVLQKERPEAVADFQKLKKQFEKDFSAFDKKWGL